jgi:hypothetical protein
VAGRRCFLCAKVAGSLEHAWPEWLQQWMNPRKERRVVQLSTGVVIDANGWGLATHRHICSDCNRWMGDEFEGPVAPIIRSLNTSGTVCTLSSADQRLLASWAYKTSLMLECTQVGRVAVERGECARFRRNGRPPSDCSIVLGFSEHEGLAYHRSLLIDERQQRWGYVSMLLAGRVLFHILGDVRALNPHDRLLAQAMSRRLLVRLTPSTGTSTEWPLGGYFSKTAVDNWPAWAATPSGS